MYDSHKFLAVIVKAYTINFVGAPVNGRSEEKNNESNFNRFPGGIHHCDSRAAFHFRVLKFHATKELTQLSVRNFQGVTATFFAKTWLAALAGVAFAIAVPKLVTHLGALLTTGVMIGLFAQNYLWPATGAASPTAAQVANQDSVVVDCTTDGVITTFTLTHNLNISAADILAGWPDILIENNSPTGIPATLLIMITRPIASGNAVIFTCAAIAATFRVKIKRPHTIGR